MQSGGARNETRSPQRCDSRTLRAHCFDLADSAKIPLRPTHNDTKITNVLFDERSGEALCVVDLDTVMPGLMLFDVGELVRTAAHARSRR